MPTAFTIRVECYSGYKGEERPHRFYLGKETFEIEEILDRWYGPDSDYFKVKANDGQNYILRRHRDQDGSPWTLESYSRELSSHST